VGSELLLIIVVAPALAFDFTNGFHDTANAMATSIASPGTSSPGRCRCPPARANVLVEKVLVPALLSPIIAGLVAIAGTLFAYQLVARLREGEARRGYRMGQIGSASLVSLAHGTNDAQKTMGIITLALIAHGNLDADNFTVPFWVKASCGVAIAASTYVGGWRIINTMGNRLTTIGSPRASPPSPPARRSSSPRRISATRRRRRTSSPAASSGRASAIAWRRCDGHRRPDGRCMAADHPRRGGRWRRGLGSLRPHRSRQRRDCDRRPRRSGAGRRPLRRGAADAQPRCTRCSPRR
jgi:phosphate transporter family protein